jgi:hypothetical protein
MSYAGCVTPFNAAKRRNPLLVHACGHEVTGLKTYRSQKRKDQLGVRGIFKDIPDPRLHGACARRQQAAHDRGVALLLSHRWIAPGCFYLGQARA